MEKKEPIITDETASIQHPDYQQELVSLIRSGISPEYCGIRYPITMRTILPRFSIF